jgi:DNA polymerase-3 subunit epsilon
MQRNRLITEYKKLSRLVQDGTIFCAFDTETTGLYSEKDFVIEIGAVKFDKTGVLGTFDSLVNPNMPLPPMCTQLSHITDDMVKEAPPVKDVLPSFLRFAGDSVLVAHNACFDLNFVNKELERSSMPYLKNKAIDTLALSRWAYPLNEKWKLQYLAEQFKIEVRAAHRADDDARVCMEVFLRCIADTMSIQK